MDEDSWLYKACFGFKKNQVFDTELYECHNDHFVAYKSIRNDGYSHYFNFQYQYLKGGSMNVIVILPRMKILWFISMDARASKKL